MIGRLLFLVAALAASVALGVTACGGDTLDPDAAPETAQDAVADAAKGALEDAATEIASSAGDALSDAASDLVSDAADNVKKKAKKAKKDLKEKAEQVVSSKQVKKKRKVSVTLGAPSEFALTPARRKVKTGRVTFKIDNSGLLEHELLVIETELDSAELPTDADGAAIEDDAAAPQAGGGANVRATVPAGDAGSLTVELEPGSYALACNIPGHYASGMHVNFTVVA